MYWRRGWSRAKYLRYVHTYIVMMLKVDENEKTMYICICMYDTFFSSRTYVAGHQS